MTIGTSRSNFGGLRGAYEGALEEMPYNYDTLDAQSGWTVDPTRPNPLAETAEATEEAEQYVQGQRLKEKAKKDGGFLAQAAEIFAPGVQGVMESFIPGSEEIAKAEERDMQARQARAEQMGQQSAQWANQTSANVRIPRINYSRMPGRTRPLQVPNVPQPKPQPPYNLLRTDYGFPMTQKMTPSERLKAKAKGMR